MPDFGSDRPEGATDLNDLHPHAGLDAVRSAITGAKAPDIEDTAEDMDATVRRLAALSPLQYDQVRIAEAEALGVRVVTLDSAVEKARRKLAGSSDDLQGDVVPFPDVKPWPEPVDGSALLIDLAATCRSYVALPKHADDVLLPMGWTSGRASPSRT